MSKPTVEEVLERFPWLKAQFPHGGQLLEDAKIEAFNYEFLSREAGYWNDKQSGFRQVNIYLLASDGRRLGTVQKRRPWLSSIISGSWTRTVRQALDVLGPEASEVMYALEDRISTITVYEPLLHYPPSNLLAMELNNREEARQRWAKENAAKV